MVYQAYAKIIFSIILVSTISTDLFQTVSLAHGIIKKTNSKIFIIRYKYEVHYCWH